MKRSVVWGTSIVGVVAAGFLWLSGIYVAAGACVVAAAALLLAYRVWQLSPPPSLAAAAGPVSSGSGPSPPPEPVEDSETLAELMLTQGRYALLLRPQIAESISPSLLARAQEVLDEQMTLVPAGECIVGRSNSYGDDVPEHLDGRVIRVDGYYLDRYQITNQQYAQFVEAGGYEQLSLWDPEIVPALLDFVDQTGQPGPRYWKDGTYEPHLASHPVVGVCWYEAAAYARWVGKRLPTDPEWVKAGSWPVPLPGARPVQRQFPWGDAFDQAKANLWGCGCDGTVPVDRYEEGMSVGGAYQLIGNVWEWTSSRFGAWQASGNPLVLDASMRSVRGGAFDTYFERQATCEFQSGDKAIARKRNIGFRCAIGLCDLIPDQSMEGELDEMESPEQELAEVNP